MGIGVAVFCRGYVGMGIDPDKAKISVLSMQIVKRSLRHHAVPADGDDFIGLCVFDFTHGVDNPAYNCFFPIDTVGYLFFFACRRKDVHPYQGLVFIFRQNMSHQVSAKIIGLQSAAHIVRVQ